MAGLGLKKIKPMVSRASGQTSVSWTQITLAVSLSWYYLGDLRALFCNMYVMSFFKCQKQKKKGGVDVER